MANASISGLASGLDTATIISQLMQLEAAPQTRLTSRLTSEQATLKALQDLNGRIAALATRASGLADPAGWSKPVATSSSEHVGVSTTSSAVAGSLDVTVGQTARAHRLSFATTAHATDVVVSGGTTIDLTIGGTTTVLATGDGTLAGVVSALNAGGTGVRATTVALDDGTQRLVVTAAATGAASTFTLTSHDGTPLLGGAAVTTGQDAAITIGTDTLHAATNTFSNPVPGMTLTISEAAVGSTATIAVADDPAAIRTQVKELVDAVNAALADIDRLTAYNPTTKTSGILAGDGGVRALRSALLTSIYPADGSSLASVGIQTDRSGRLVLDEAKLAAAYAADPEATRAKFTEGAVDGFAERLSAVAKAASDRFDGTLTASVTGQTRAIDRIQDSIEAWDVRLELRRTTLTRQFTALETALSQLNSQSTWLAGQISSLTGSAG